MSNNTMSYKYIKNNFPFFPFLFCLCYKLSVYLCVVVVFVACILTVSSTTLFSLSLRIVFLFSNINVAACLCVIV